MRRLLVYAGPNGSGKSSLRDRNLAADSVDLVIDPKQYVGRRCPVRDGDVALAGHVRLANQEQRLMLLYGLCLE